jgi:prepilin-type N-terminal cleavage/methylation domain-containing protein
MREHSLTTLQPPRGRRCSGSGGRRDDRGYTLIEILCTITLMGIVVVGIMAAIRTSVMASSTAYDGAAI